MEYQTGRLQDENENKLVQNRDGNTNLITSLKQVSILD